LSDRKKSFSFDLVALSIAEPELDPLIQIWFVFRIYVFQFQINQTKAYSALPFRSGLSADQSGLASYGM